MKMVLALFNETETNMITEFKSNAFDKLSIAQRLAENSREFRDEIAIAEMRNDSENISMWNENLEALKKKISDLDLEFLESCLTIQVTGSRSSAEYASLRSQYRDLVFHTAGCLSPRNFLVNLDTFSGTSQGRIQFSIFHADRAALKQDFVLEKLKVTVSCPAKSPFEARMIYEEGSVLVKVKVGLAEVEESDSNVGQVLVSIKQQKWPVEISVKLFDCNIVGSPRTVGAPQLSNEENQTAANGSIALFDATQDLDQSDIVSLDMTGRRMQQHLGALRRPGSGPGPGLCRPTRMAPLMEMEEEVGASNLTKVRPRLQAGVGAPKSILKQQTLMDPPDSASNSPFAPRFKGTLLSDAIQKLSEGTYDDRENVNENTLNKSMSVSINHPQMTMPLEEKEEADPHLYLNESKAPSPSSLKKTIVGDPWADDEMEEEESTKEADLNVSILPEATAQMDLTLWEDQEVVRFNFALGNLEEVGRLETQLTAVSSSRGEVKCMESPESVALLPHRHLMLVTEPIKDRIGLYCAITFKFVGWLHYPVGSLGGKKSFIKPNSLLVLDDMLVITDSEEILILRIRDRTCTLNFKKMGNFHGLARKSLEEFVSISKETEGTFLVSFRRTKKYWTISNKTIVASRQTSSNIRFLTVSNNKVFMTDQNSHRLIQIDLASLARSANLPGCSQMTPATSSCVTPVTTSSCVTP